ncbi:MAG: T9SS type A sorting domain-containing protein [Flavobacteriales bacterium]|jgi:hypothetical protein|nr:T9SS type A sorting domain-containing protein [Flavobacteriales bacterium]
MKANLISLVAAFAVSSGASAQQWLAPGACWDLVGEHIGQTLYRYRYVGDTVLGGYEAQAVHYTLQDITLQGPVSPVFMQFYRMEGSAVMSICGGLFCPPDAVWDTLLWLGSPGDRWMGDDVDPVCYPLGVIEIQDTGHVIIQGLSLRTWDIAYLDENGVPIPESALPNFGDSLGIIERVRWNLSPPPQPCEGPIIDYFWFTRTHYSDVDISLPEGSTCDIITSASERSDFQLFAVVPNPCTDHFILNNTTPITIAVRDALGRILQSELRLDPREPVSTEEWPSGTYFVSVTGPHGSHHVLRWVKQ